MLLQGILAHCRVSQASLGAHHSRKMYATFELTLLLVLQTYTGTALLHAKFNVVYYSLGGIVCKVTSTAYSETAKPSAAYLS